MSMLLDTDQPSPSKETGSARVYAQLRQDILRVAIAPGAPLDEVGLSERFGLSRSPIREALVRLSSEGLVVILPNRSTIVTPIDVQSIPEFLDALDLLQRVTTRLAAIHRTDADIKRIEAARIAFEKGAQKSIDTGNSLPMIESNHAFHMAIAEAGRNSYFQQFYKRILDEGRRMLHYHFEFQARDPDNSVDKMASGHREMLDAIRERDPDRAEQIAHVHATMFKGRFIQFFDRNVTAKMRLGHESGAESAI
ncbi:GntR family transcriptional regulator [Chelatococcus sp. GCM10030263]|uniref:GntR family transcriptional regulator n=1 Tax=Chelatococcus sp. GCM10030263 TaxID=3273387 RepID=UPI003614BF9D